jgi:hypothetical protein
MLDEAFLAPEQTAPCRLTGGEWYSAYDNLFISSPGGLDVDHLVPLAEAWDSGASQWTPEAREAYANDLGDERCAPRATPARGCAAGPAPRWSYSSLAQRADDRILIAEVCARGPGALPEGCPCAAGCPQGRPAAGICSRPGPAGRGLRGPGARAPRPVGP